jgi:hypothetical protein
MISQFGGGSNNNSQAGSTCGSESPLPSPRFTRYIRTPQTSDTNNTGGANSENSRPCSATSSSTYSPRLGKICSQPPSVHIGEFMNCGFFWKDLVLFRIRGRILLSHVLKYLLPKIRKDLLTASLSTHWWIDECGFFFWKDLVLFSRLKSQILLSHLIKYLPTFKKNYMASLTCPISANLIPTRAGRLYPQHCYWHPQILWQSSRYPDNTIFRPIHT